MESEMKDLIQELEKAINEAVSESDRIASIVGDMKGAGYDVCLLLETTVALTAMKSARRDVAADGPADLDICFTEQDQRFLEDLKIAVVED
ncbi:MAG TPA: hypothetical protein VMH80_17690 [Bryobacteraceae bacterium]|nr:hypothetical protein [Bryobacteraceae bacterium]